MHRVKFFSVYDWSSGSNMKLAENILNKFDSSKNDYSINEVIEFYNIIKFIDNGIFLKEWVEDYIQKIKGIVKEYKRIIRLFFQNINDDNFMNLYEEVEKEYKEDFWKITDKYKVYEKVSNIEFEKLINNNKISFPQILKNKNLTEYYGEIIRECLLSNADNAELILDKYEIKHSTPKDDIFLPALFSNVNKETLILNYIRSSNPSLNYLRIIVNIQSRKEAIEISDRTRLEAKKRMIAEEKRIFDKNNGIQMGTIVKFCENQEKAYELKHNGKDIECSYSLKWIQDNLDFNTLLNNFIYLFGYVDGQMRITLVNKTNELGIFEKFSLNSKKSYITGTEYTLKNMLANLQILGYYQQLERLDVRLENVIEWFFREYLSKEFDINDYRIIMPSCNSSYLEKCRAVLPEIESALKQYELFVVDGKINHELLQMSSGHLLFKDCKSLVNKKYIYASQGEFDKVTYYLFSDQCMLSYVERIDEKYNNFYDLLIHEKITIADYPDYEIVDLKWLLDNSYIKINDTGYIELENPIQVYIFKDLNDNGVINYWMCPKIYRKEIDSLINIGFLSFENTLFSKPEQDYYNYHLNKTKFNNSLDLRNMYSHGTQPNDVNDEKKHRENYMIFLKLFILSIIKINDELCIVNDDYSKKLV